MIKKQTSARQNTAIPNRLLAMLPASDVERVLAECKRVDLAFGSTLWDPGDRVRHIYFPIDAFVSLLTVVDDHTLEVGMVGSEGMCGHSLALGVEVATLRALVQGGGACWQMKAGTFQRQLELIPALRPVINRYIHVLFQQLAQTAACTRFHVVESRLARWLLMTGDRAHADTFEVTQEFLAFMLGVRRVGVTAAAVTLQSRGLIRYTRGRIVILDRGRLEASACVCYGADLESYEREFGSRRKTAKRAVSR